MPTHSAYDAVVVGSGPNGLAAAITLARAGCSVLVIEACDTLGGGMRSAALTLPGFVHDVCSAIHPLGVASPFMRTVPLAEHGVTWINPPAAVAHPFDDGTAAVLERSIPLTGETLGPDAAAYERLMAPLVQHWEALVEELLRPLHLPRHPLAMARFGLLAMHSARGLAEAWFTGVRARGLFAGLAAHSIMPLDRLLTAAFGLMLGMLGHTVGWPLPQGGSQQLTTALVAYLRALGGELVTGTLVASVDEVPPARAILLDITPCQVLRLAGHRLPARYRRQLERYRYGAAVFKMDWALNGPIPWKAQACLRAATVHLGGTLPEIAASERAACMGQHTEAPYMILAQQSLYDATRAPAGQHTAWAYCHVPHGSTVDMTARLEAQIERFAPGFRDCILARSVMSPTALEQYNANYVGGDINGGVQDLGQLFTRPTVSFVPYATPVKGLYICSSSTPPGGGVHGMCGYWAARAALRRDLGQP
jgi:phytoene dehydrogenase-like protein